MKMIKNKKIFITGGAGFIGTSLVSRLCHENHITIFDNLTRNTLKLTDLNSSPNIKFVQGDILDVAALKEAARGCEIFVHGAAIAGIDNTVKNPVNTLKVNMLGTLNALEVANELGTFERFLEFSTSEVFGPYAFNAKETDGTIIGAVGEARWTYAVSKLTGEHLAHSYYKEFGLPIVSVRPFNIYGPGQTGEGAISIMIRKALKNEDIMIFGDGCQIRSWCYIDDMVEGLVRSLHIKEAEGESFNLGNTSATVSVLSLAKMICKLLDSKSQIICKDPLSADIYLRVPCVKKAKDILGFEAKIGLEEGLLATAEWIKNNDQHLPEIPKIFSK